MHAEDGLASSLAGLGVLLLGHRRLEQTLTDIAEFAVRAVPHADGAGLTLLEEHRAQTVVATSAFVREVDRIQYEVVREGPCLSAVAAGRTFWSGNLGGETQWPRFGPRAGRLGVHSVVSLPLLLPGRALGALNVYARSRDAFNDRAVQLGEAFAPHAAASVSNAQLLAQADRLIAELHESLASRAEIDQAIGLVMSRTGLDAAAALDRLRSLSQARSVKVSEVARELLETAVLRARARGTRRPEAGAGPP